MIFYSIEVRTDNLDMEHAFFVAWLGGLIACLATVVGVALTIFTPVDRRIFGFKFSMDFALGLMLSAVAFSLVGPAASSIGQRPDLLWQGFLSFVVGGILIYGLRSLVERIQNRGSLNHPMNSSRLLLALSLMVHNLPEGMASGAALAGLDASTANSLLLAIGLQNVPEGLLMVLCLKSLGLSSRLAILGGIGSGVVELLGGGISGFAMSWTSESLPLILMIAGGAMFTSVAIEIMEKGRITELFKKPEFAFGFFTIPLLSLLVR